MICSFIGGVRFVKGEGNIKRAGIKMEFRNGTRLDISGKNSEYLLSQRRKYETILLSIRALEIRPFGFYHAFDRM